MTRREWNKARLQGRATERVDEEERVLVARMTAQQRRAHYAAKRFEEKLAKSK